MHSGADLGGWPGGRLHDGRGDACRDGRCASVRALPAAPRRARGADGLVLPGHERLRLGVVAEHDADRSSMASSLDWTLRRPDGARVVGRLAARPARRSAPGSRCGQRAGSGSVVWPVHCAHGGTSWIGERVADDGDRRGRVLGAPTTDTTRLGGVASRPAGSRAAPGRRPGTAKATLATLGRANGRRHPASTRADAPKQRLLLATRSAADADARCSSSPTVALTAVVPASRTHIPVAASTKLGQRARRAPWRPGRVLHQGLGQPRRGRRSRPGCRRERRCRARRGAPTAAR